MIRRPYTTKFRPFRDSDMEVDIVWYPCRDDAPDLPYESAAVSLDWWVQERQLGVYSAYKVGEVPGHSRNYNNQKVKPAANGLHQCGTEDDFRNGAVFDTSVNRPFRKDGLPECCGMLPGGVVVGGAIPVQTGRGGAVVGGFGYQDAQAGQWPFAGSSNFYFDPYTLWLVSCFFPPDPRVTFDTFNLLTGRTYKFELWTLPTDGPVSGSYVLSGVHPINWTGGGGYWTATETIVGGGSAVVNNDMVRSPASNASFMYRVSRVL